MDNGSQSTYSNGCYTSEAFDYQITFDGRDMHWVPPFDSVDLARALAFRFPLLRTYEDRVTAATHRFFLGNQHSQSQSEAPGGPHQCNANVRGSNAMRSTFRSHSSIDPNVFDSALSFTPSIQNYTSAPKGVSHGYFSTNPTSASALSNLSMQQSLLQLSPSFMSMGSPQLGAPVEIHGNSSRSSNNTVHSRYTCSGLGPISGQTQSPGSSLPQVPVVPSNAYQTGLGGLESNPDASLIPTMEGRRGWGKACGKCRKRKKKCPHGSQVGMTQADANRVPSPQLPGTMVNQFPLGLNRQYFIDGAGSMGESAHAGSQVGSYQQTEEDSQYSGDYMPPHSSVYKCSNTREVASEVDSLGREDVNKNSPRRLKKWVRHLLHIFKYSNSVI